MSFIDALFALIIGSTGIPGGCDGPLSAFVNDEACIERPVATDDRGAAAAGKQPTSDEDDPKPVQQKFKRNPGNISNGF